MNTDIRIAVSFLGHRKRKRLRMLLGAGSTDCLLDLWISTAMNHPSGVLSGMDEIDIALEAGWEGDAQKFVDAMLQSGFLERMDDGTYRLHDWEEHQAYVIKSPSRKAAAQDAARVRWEKDRMRKACGEHADGMQPALPDDANGNAPLPSPVPVPDPKPKRQKTPPTPASGGDLPGYPPSPVLGNSARELRAKVEAYTDSAELRAALEDFRVMRERIRKPLTQAALGLTIRDLDKFAGEDTARKVAIVQQSVQRGWQGIFQLKGDFQAQANGPEDMEAALARARQCNAELKAAERGRVA